MGNFFQDLGGAIGDLLAGPIASALPPGLSQEVNILGTAVAGHSVSALLKDPGKLFLPQATQLGNLLSFLGQGTDPSSLLSSGGLPISPIVTSIAASQIPPSLPLIPGTSPEVLSYLETLGGNSGSPFSLGGLSYVPGGTSSGSEMEPSPSGEFMGSILDTLTDLGSTMVPGFSDALELGRDIGGALGIGGAPTSQTYPDFGQQAEEFPSTQLYPPGITGGAEQEPFEEGGSPMPSMPPGMVRGPSSIPLSDAQQYLPGYHRKFIRRKATAARNGWYLVRNRRMNPFNIHALRRSLRRTHAATTLARRLFHLPKTQIRMKCRRKGGRYVR